MHRLARWPLNALTVLSLLLCVATVASWVRSRRAIVQAPFIWRGARCRVYVWHGSAGMDNAPEEREYNLRTAAVNERKRFQRQAADLAATAHRMAESPLAQSTDQWSHLGDQADADERAAIADVEDARCRRAELRFKGPWSCESRFVPAAAAAVTLALPGIRLLRAARKRARRGDAGRCLACGYDLTGNVSGICPECGTARTPVEGASKTGGKTC
jgi:hypothetical protein